MGYLTLIGGLPWWAIFGLSVLTAFVIAAIWSMVFRGGKPVDGSILSRPEFDWSFNKLIRHVAYESEWACTFNPTSKVDQWQTTFWWKPLKKEIFRPLVSGDVRARGVLHAANQEPDNGPTEIPIGFWRRADFSPEHALSYDQVNSAVNSETREIYEDIEIVGVEALRLWPVKGKDARKRPSPFIGWHQEWADEQEDARIARDVQYQSTQDQRRKDIALCREMIASYDGGIGLAEQRQAMEANPSYLALRRYLPEHFLDFMEQNALAVIDGKAPNRPMGMHALNTHLGALEEKWRLNG